MGLIVDGNSVIVDHQVSDHLHTTSTGNPTEQLVGSLLIHSIFKRLKNSQKFSRHREQKKIGDNCPLVYALKGKQNLTTSVTSIKTLFDYFPEILDGVCQKFDGKVDGVVAMPSGFPLAECLATRIARHTGIPIFREVFRKSTNAEASAEISTRFNANPKSFSREDEKHLRNSLKKMRKAPNDAYSAKNVGVGVRQQFVPLQIHSLPSTPNCRLLFVDDLLATGETLLCGQRHLRESGFPEPSHAVTWFSGV